jgi:hypothetical protein
MKNLIKLLGIAVMVAVIGLAFVACPEPEPEEEDGPTSYGDKLEFSNEQVYVIEQKIEGNKVTFEYKPYTGADITFNSVCGAAPKIAGGKFSFSVGVPAAQYLESISEWYSDDDSYTNVNISDTTVKYVTISSFRKDSASSQANMSRQNIFDFNGTVSESGSIIPESGTTESVSFVYVDKDVTITGTGKGRTYTINTIKFNDINLSLSKGWNTLCSKAESSSSATTMSATITLSVSNPSSAKWVLFDNN